VEPDSALTSLVLVSSTISVPVYSLVDINVFGFINSSLLFEINGTLYDSNSEVKLQDVAKKSQLIEAGVLFPRSISGEVPIMRFTGSEMVYELKVQWCSYLPPTAPISALFDTHLYKLKEQIVYMAELLKASPTA
jgi:hypothetical protein